jgi:uncharacterized repeat protein (TIGR01451 family)
VVTAFVGFGSTTGTVSVNYSNVFGATGSEPWWNATNTTANAFFVNAAINNYRLQETSSLIDAATNNVYYTGTDIAGVTRPQGTGFDIGAYELIPLPPVIVNLTTSVNYSSVQSALDAAIAGDILEIFATQNVTGNVLWPNTNDLTLRGLSSIPTPTVQGDGTNSVIRVSQGVSLSIQNLIISGGNTASSGGGLAVNNASAAVYLKNVYVSGNNSTAAVPNGGGGLIVGAGLIVIEDSFIINNTASGIGGGLYATGGSAKVEIYRSVISSNNAAIGGGIGGFTGSAVTMAATLLDHNYASVYFSLYGGGAGGFFGSNIYLENNTVVANTSAGNIQNGFLILDDTHFTAINTVIRNTAASEIATANAGSGTDYLPVLQYSNIENAAGTELWWNATNSTADALFVNATARNYQLQSGSPLINTATNNVVYTGTDMIGTTRPQGSAYDIGAYEYIAAGGSPVLVLQSFEIDANGIRAPSANGYTGNETDLVPGSLITYKIQIYNTGTATANNIKIIQAIPVHTTFYNIPANSEVTESSGLVDAVNDVDYFDGQGISPTNTWLGDLSSTPSGNINRIRYNVFELAPGASKTVRYSVTVD